MKKKIYCVLFCITLISSLAGCGTDYEDTKEEAIINNVESMNHTEVSEDQSMPEIISEAISEEQALNAIRKYCISGNPDLENMINKEEYTIYWDIISSDDSEIVILYRSYTGAENYYYIDRNSGNTVVTEFVPGIMDEEQQTNETFNVKDYIE